MSKIHTKDIVRCEGCKKCYCRDCEDRCPACYDIHISIYKPSQLYAETHPALPILPKRENNGNTKLASESNQG